MRRNFVMSGVAEGLRRNLLMSIALILTAAVSLSFVAAAILTGIEINRFRDQYREKLGVNLYLCDQIQETNCTAGDHRSRAGRARGPAADRSDGHVVHLLRQGRRPTRSGCARSTRPRPSSCSRVTCRRPTR